MNKIRELREEKSIRAEDLANRLGITVRYLYDLERGNRRLNEDLINRLCDILGVEAGYLLGRTGDTNPAMTIKEALPVYGSEGPSPSKAQAQMEELLKKLPDDPDVKISYIKVIEKYQKKGLSPEQLDRYLEFLLETTELVKSKFVDK